MFLHSPRYRQFVFLLSATLFFFSCQQLWAVDIRQLKPTNPSPTPARITLKPDLLLAPHTLKLSKQRVTAGEQINVRAIVQNQDAKILNKVRVRFSCGKEKKDIFINLRPKQRQQVQVKLAIPGPAGRKTVQVEVNPNHRELSERNYKNNSGTTPVTVIDKLSIVPQQDKPTIHRPSPNIQTSPTPPATKFPIVTGVHPNTLKAGKTYSLKLTGKYIKKGISLGFGKGIKIAGNPATFDGYIMAPVVVDANAAPGKRQISLHYNGKRKIQRLGLTVQAWEKLIITRISPSPLLQNHKYMLNIQGKGFPKTMSILFDRDIKPIGKMRVISSNKAQQNVQITPSARPGSHTVTLQAGQSSQNPAMLMGSSSQKATGTVQIARAVQQTPTIEQLASPPSLTLLPRLTSINPARWQLGKQYTISAHGSHLDTIRTLSFGAGVQVRQLKHHGDNRLSFTVSITKTTQTGPRQITVHHKWGQQKSKLKAWIIEKPGQPAVASQVPDLTKTLTQQPRITVISPSRWKQGKEYNITILGSQLNQIEMISFGEGVEISRLKHHGDNRLTFLADIAKTSRTGSRSAIIGHTGSQQNSGIKAWIIKKVPTLNTLPPLIWEPDLLEVQQGAIYLTTPEWSYSGDISTIKPLPVLNDQTLFAWREETAGLADLFEIRFFTPKGQFIESRIINSGQAKFYTTAFKPSNQFITELFEKYRSVTLKTGLNQNPPETINGIQVIAPRNLHNNQKTDSPTKSTQISNSTGINFSFQAPVFSAVPLDKGKLREMTEVEKYTRDKGDEVDLLWQVIGYKRVLRNGNSIVQNSNALHRNKSAILAKTTELIEIEVSEKWPLGLPDSWPTGVTCDADNQLKLTIDGKHSNGVNPGDGNYYPGDTIRVEGTFSIKNSPWGISANTTYKEGDTIEDSAYHFNNIIIDWGDGIHWQRLETTAADPSNLPGWAETDLMHTSAVHQYTAPGEYQIRLYVVPDDEMGQIEAIVAAHGYRPPNSIADAGGTPAMQTPQASDKQLREKTNVSSMQQQSMFQNNQIEKIGSRIFMLFCEPLPITIIQDTAATGALHLDSIKVTSFSSDSAPASSDMQAKPAVMHTIKDQTQTDITSITTTVDIANISSSGQDTIVSTCAGGLWATGKLKYFGQGYANIQWLVDDIIVDSKKTKVGPSELRQDLQSPDAANQGEPRYTVFTIRSPRLPVTDIGSHKIQVRATVAEDPTLSLVNSVALQSYSKSLSRQGTVPKTNKSGKALVPISNTAFQPSFLPGTSAKGVLHASQANDTKALFKNLKNTFRKNNTFTKTISNPPFSVISSKKNYLVQENSSDVPCRFLFPTQEGTFEINDLQALQVNGTSYSGNGLLLLTMADGPHSNGEQPVRIPFINWQVDNSSTVQQGAIKAFLQEHLDELPGMQATMTGLAGNAGDHLNATMDVRLKDTTIRLIGAEVPQQWSNVSSILTPDGDWYADGLPLGKSLIGWSMTSIESRDVRLDLSRSQGETISCGYGGNDWVGVHLGTATLYPYLFDLTEIPLDVYDWGLSADGLCGHAETSAFNSAFGDGSIGWEKLTLNAFKSSLNARYKNFYVEMAWPEVRLESSSAHYSYAPGSQVDIQLGLDDLPVIEEHYDLIDMTITPESFSHTEEGWGLLADAELTFRDEQQGIFAKEVPINDLFFTIQSEVLYGGSTINLNIQSQLGGADEVISAMDVTTGGTTEKRKLTLDFTTEFSLEKLGKAEHPVHILYGINKDHGGDAYSTSPVHPGEITLKSDYPKGSPILTNTFAIKYHRSSDQLAFTKNAPMYAANFGYSSVMSDAWPNTPLLATVASVSGGAGGHDTFGGTVDTNLFGSSTQTIAGTFRFGEIDGNRYWLTFYKGDNLHKHIYAGIFLEMIQGGLAYNFDYKAFNQDNGFGAEPDTEAGLLFCSGLGLSFGNENVVEVNGVLTIQPEAKYYKFDVDASLFKKVNLKGWLKYHESAFDGSFGGDFSLFDNNISLKIPVETSDDMEAQVISSGFHVDSSEWYFNAGTEDHPVTGEILSLKSGLFLSLGNKIGFKAGASDTLNLDQFCCRDGFGFSGHASLKADFDFTLDPKQITGTLTGSVHGTFINPVKDIGLGLDITGWTGCCNPVNLGFSFYKKCCCVKGEATVTVLPDPGFGASAGWYCGKFW